MESKRHWTRMLNRIARSNFRRTLHFPSLYHSTTSPPRLHSSATRTSDSDPSSSSSASLSNLGLLGNTCKLFLLSRLGLGLAGGVLSICQSPSPANALHILTTLGAPGTSTPSPTPTFPSLSLSLHNPTAHSISLHI
jgi:hypothetical protein